MFNNEEILRLQKLSAISLGEQESVKLTKQLSSIVDFLGKLNNISNESGVLNDNKKHCLEPISGVKEYDDKESLFINVKHKKMGNSIVVNSVIDN